jgi:hypothetical protein
MIKHIIGFLAALTVGAMIAAGVALVVFPERNNFSYAPAILVFPALSVWVSAPAYVISMLVLSFFTHEPDKMGRHIRGVIISSVATFIASLVLAAVFWHKGH